MTSKYLKFLSILLITVVAFVCGIILASKLFQKPNVDNNTEYYNQNTDTIISKTKLLCYRPTNPPP